MLQLLLSRYSRKLLAQLPPFPSMLRLKHSESTAVSPCSERPSQPSTGSENVQSYQWFNFIFSPQKTVDENVNGSGVISCDGVPPRQVNYMIFIE
ncbi:hypothetical protein AB6A40_005343 [Gnathostoma spinigerum]|uniref:Uncharacterized protein n=1 Tax=Gnathostoma spinigerum TaxID=75299 RepID=A0ABD6EMT7_9BILA